MAHPTHYLDFMIREAPIARDLHARLLLVAHYRILAGDELFVSWPDWKDLPGEFGYLFRVFGNEQALANYLVMAKPLTDAGLVRAYQVQSTPETALRSVSFVRNRSRDKFSPSAVERLKRRAAARGETWAPSDKTPKGTPHFLVIPSTSHQCNFSLHIARTSKEMREPTGGRNYGLGLLLPDF